MRILHLMLSCFYIDNAGYQENIIPKNNKSDGHDVQIIASIDIIRKDNKPGVTDASEYYNEDGIKVIRLPYKKVINHFISRKVRAYKGLAVAIERFSPDIILFHGACAWALNDVVKYKRRHPQVMLYVDSHEDLNNSARGFFSKQILHQLFYKNILKYNLSQIDKILYITKETYTFLNEFYKIPEEKLFFFPLGGTIPTDKTRNDARERIRKELKIESDELVCIHSGKLDPLKRTIETIEGFNKAKSSKLKLIIIGSAQLHIKECIFDFEKKDSRISFLGWKTTNEIQDFLMAGDLYIQLGSQSATMQQAICNGCAVALFPYDSHLFLLKDKAYYIKNANELTDLLNDITKNRQEFSLKRKNLNNFAYRMLDYKKISKLIYDKNNF